MSWLGLRSPQSPVDSDNNLREVMFKSEILFFPLGSWLQISGHILPNILKLYNFPWQVTNSLYIARLTFLSGQPIGSAIFVGNFRGKFWLRECCDSVSICSQDPNGKNNISDLNSTSLKLLPEATGVCGDLRPNQLIILTIQLLPSSYCQRPQGSVATLGPTSSFY